MSNTLTSDSSEMFPGLELLEEEQVVLSGYASERLRNPLQPDMKHHDGFVLTDRRLIMLARPRSVKIFGAKIANLTAMPLKEIDCVQTLDVRWGFMSVVAFLFFCLLYIIPGIIFLFYMMAHTGLWLQVYAGSSTNELKFSRDDAKMLSEMIDLIQKHHKR